MVHRGELAERFREVQAKLVIQTSDLPLGTLAEMVEAGSIDLEPGFQRRERWSLEKQSALIESFLLNIPVPPIYLAEELDGTYTAIDGKQRLRAITDFINSRFHLYSLEKLEEAQGIGYRDLPSEIINAFKLRPYFRVVTLLKQSDALLKYEVFLRLNRGGESLNAQEIRNVAFRGVLNDRIYQLAESDFLRRSLKISGKSSSSFRDMDDAEYILRFLTLSEPGKLEKFSGSLVREMDDFMRNKQDLNEEEVGALELKFNTAVERCERIWGKFAFRRPEKELWRDQMLAGMYDAQMIAAYRVSGEVAEKAERHHNEVLSRTRNLFLDPDFDKAVRTGTNTPQRIRYRVNKMKEMLESI